MIKALNRVAEIIGLRALATEELDVTVTPRRLADLPATGWARARRISSDIGTRAGWQRWWRRVAHLEAKAIDDALDCWIS